MPYDNSQVYAKYLLEGNGCCEDDCGCDKSDCGCNDCGCEDKKCSCCPPGLVAIYNDKGEHSGCLTPSDAEQFTNSSYVCDDGYVKVYDSTGQFLGCVTQDVFVTIYTTLNP